MSSSCNCGIVTCAACIGVGFPTTLHVTFSNSGKCSVYDGLTFALTWNAANNQWQNFSITGPDSCAYNLVFRCRGTPFNDFNLVCYQGVVTSWNAGLSTCTPISIVFQINNHSTCASCNNGGANFLLTATVTL